MSSTPRPLVVKTGSTVAPLVPRRGDFEDWFAAGLGLGRDGIELVRVDHGEPLPDVDPGRAVVVTGSPSMVTEEAPWSLACERWLAEAARAGAPVLAVCYGHQLLARGLGGEAGWNPRGREIGTVRVRLTDAGRSDPLLGGLGPELLVQTSHSQSVLALPPEAVHLAANDHDPWQAFRFGERAWGVQFHPEFDADIVRGYLEERRDAVRSEGRDVDALLAATADGPAGGTVLERFARLAGL